MEGLPTPEDIVAKWSKDCDIDLQNISSDLSRNANLYSYYLDIYLKYRVKKRQALSKLEKIDKIQTDYLKGRLPVDGKLFPYKLMSDEFKTYKKANDDYQKAQERLEAFQIGVDILERILDQVKQRSFDIRAIKDLKKLEDGY